jgi:UDP-N-acetyl-D-galactosamine dehydrogenase
MTPSPSICVIGLGYVGLPLAVALAPKFRTIGFDIDAGRIAELKNGHDRTNEIEDDRLAAVGLDCTAEAGDIAGYDVYIVTVPTPVDEDNNPDLAFVLSGCEIVGKAMGKGAVVVFESTVYPGVTEDVCGPALEKVSGLVRGEDFFLGYSPERINPGDREHTVDRITKVIAGENAAVTDLLETVYGAVTTGGVFRAANIRTAEAAKVIENAQRDINIAFVNEIAMIFRRMGISVHDVLEASRTKWNFLPFTPGLVGGHCIGVDPHYLANAAIRAGIEPEVVLSGRRINDGMGIFVAEQIAEQIEAAFGGYEGKRVLVLGLTFKENVPDLRNTRVVDVISCLAAMEIDVDVHDPRADAAETKQHYGLKLMTELPDEAEYDCIVGLVPHDEIAALTPADLLRLMKPGGVVADIKAIWRGQQMPDGLKYWGL